MIIDKNRMHGAWILETGEVHFLDDISSHRKILENLGLESKSIDEMIENGCIRITSFYNQIGIEYLNKQKLQQNKKSIISICNELIDSIEVNIILEKAFSKEYQIFYSLNELIKYLNN